MRNGSIIVLFVTFALVYARANVFGQELPLLDNSSIDPIIVQHSLDSIVTAHQLSWDNIRVTGDSLGSRIEEYFIQNHPSDPQGTIIIKRLQARVENPCPDCELLPNQYHRIRVWGQGVMTFDAAGKGSEPFSFSKIEVSAVQPVVRLPAEPPSFWESTAEPIIVTIGAAVIVALFFLIRS